MIWNFLFTFSMSLIDVFFSVISWVFPMQWFIDLCNTYIPYLYDVVIVFGAWFPFPLFFVLFGYKIGLEILLRGMTVSTGVLSTIRKLIVW